MSKLSKFKSEFVDEMRERVAAGYRARMEAMNNSGIPHRHPGFLLTDVALLIDAIDQLARERDGIAEHYEATRARLERAERVVEAARTQTNFLIAGFNAEAAQRNLGVIDVEQWLDGHEVAIMKALREYYAT